MLGIENQRWITHGLYPESGKEETISKYMLSMECLDGYA